MADINKESVREVFHGHQTVGTTRKKLSDYGFNTVKGVILRCPGTADPAANTAPVWVGGPAVTADSGPSGGMPVIPGMSIGLPIESPDLLYVISTVADQDIAWIGQ